MQGSNNLDISITPSLLRGSLRLPPSKSISHRLLICAAMADGASQIDNLLECMDSHATIDALTALGAKIQGENGKYTIEGIKAPKSEAFVDCRESGSTLRFMMPIFSAYGCEAEFTGRGKLPERPITPIIKPMCDNGAVFRTDKMPYKIGGRLSAGKYYIDGSVSSQFITGLLFALSRLDGDSEIIVTSPLQSKPYIDITINCMMRFGVIVTQTENSYFVKGNQRYIPQCCTVEADMSQSAFFVVANVLGCNINITNINPDTLQGDRAILDIAGKFRNCGDLSVINAADIPDLVPIIAVMMSFWNKPSVISDCGRLRVKECDRLKATAELINGLGGNITEHKDSLEIRPVSSLCGGTVNCHNDHRIAMAAAIAAVKCKDRVIIKDAQCVDKSYPKFFDDYTSLGGIADVI